MLTPNELYAVGRPCSVNQNAIISCITFPCWLALQAEAFFYLYQATTD